MESNRKPLDHIYLPSDYIWSDEYDGDSGEDYKMAWVSDKRLFDDDVRYILYDKALLLIEKSMLEERERHSDHMKNADIVETKQRLNQIRAWLQPK